MPWELRPKEPFGGTRRSVTGCGGLAALVDDASGAGHGPSGRRLRRMDCDRSLPRDGIAELGIAL